MNSTYDCTEYCRIVMEHGKRQGTAGKGRASPRSQAKRSGGGQYSRSPRSAKSNVPAQGGSSNSQHPFQPSSGSGGPLSGMPPSQIPPGMIPSSTGLLGAHPTHSLLGPPPPIPPGGGPGSPAQGGMMHSTSSSSQSTHKHSSSGSSHVVDLADLSGSISLEELTERIRSLGFPQSCDFVLQLLDRYFVSLLEGDKAVSTPVARDNIIALTNIFVLRQSPSHLHSSNQNVPSSSSFSSSPSTSEASAPSLAPVEETQLLLSIQSHMEGIPRLELRYCLLDAIFGGSTVNLKAGHGLGLLNKVVSLAVSIENGSHLSCVALWLQTHPNESLHLAKSLYHDFCVLLPDAMEPLLQLPVISPHMAYQMTQAFTALYPFHIVGEEPPEVSGDNLHPPLKMLQIVSHWVESCPSYLFPGQLLDQHNTTKLPLINSNSSYQSLDFYSSRSPLVGLIQWCIITPLTAALNLYGQKSHKDELLQSPRLKSPDFAFDPFNNSTNNRTDQMAAKTVKSTRDVGSMVANLHAKLLSLILSGPLPQLTGGKHSHLISGDDMRTVVSTLLSYKQKLSSVELSRTVMSSLVSWMEESVERLAQFLQILLSTSLLSMKHDELVSLSSGLPKNRLLQLVVANSRSSKK